jgi:hypothetical protein
MESFDFAKGVFWAALLGAGLTMPPPLARAEFWQDARTIAPKSTTWGGFGEYSTSPNQGLAIGQFTAGVTSALQAEARLGAATSSGYLYGGVFGKLALLRRSVLDLSFYGGAHYFKNFYADVGGIVSHHFGRVWLYAGALVQVPMQNGISVGLSLIPGIALPVSDSGQLVGEVNLDLGGAYSAFSLGIRFFR